MNYDPDNAKARVATLDEELYCQELEARLGPLVHQLACKGPFDALVAATKTHRIDPVDLALLRNKLDAALRAVGYVKADASWPGHP